MEKREISMHVLILLLDIMVIYYALFPYYSSAIEIGDGYVTLDSDYIYEKLSGEEFLVVFFSGNSEEGEVNQSFPKILPLESGTILRYPMGEESAYETIEILSLDKDGKSFSSVEGYFTYVISHQKIASKKEKKVNELFCEEESPCFKIGKATRALAEYLWECSNREEKEYVERVFRYLEKMDYDYELANSPMDEKLDANYKRMDLDAVLKKEKGICLEKANLMAALLRLKGIPCKVLSGMVSEEYESGHAWNEVYINGEWIMFDSTNSLNGYVESERDIVEDFTEYWCY